MLKIHRNLYDAEQNADAVVKTEIHEDKNNAVAEKKPVEKKKRKKAKKEEV